MKTFLVLFGLATFTFFFLGCSGSRCFNLGSKAKEEIAQAEKDFAELCSKEGIYKAFVTYSAEDARILSGDKLISGKAEIDKIYSREVFKTAKLVWAPDFVDASSSGDMGYTYGHYVFTIKDSSGISKDMPGTFHTVWKKINGQWKFVWDN